MCPAASRLFCVDCDPGKSISDDSAKALLAAARNGMADADVVILSDYGRGMLTPAVCRENYCARAKRRKAGLC